MIDTFTQFLQSPLVIRFTMTVIMAFFSFYVSRRGEHRGLRLILFMAPLLLVRDLLFAFFPVEFIFLASEMALLFLYFRLNRAYLRSQPGDRPLLVINAVILLVALTNTVVPFLPGWIWRVYLLILFVDYGLLGLLFFQITEFNTPHPQFIQRIRIPLFVGGMVFHFLIFIPGYSSLITQALLLPLYYVIPFFVITQFLRLEEDRKDTQISTLQTNLASVFDFMHKIGNAITEKLDIQTVLEDVAESAMKDVRADGSAIYMVDEFEDILVCRAHKGIFPPPYEVPPMVKTKLENMEINLEKTQIKPGETILGQAAATGEAVFIRNTAEDERMTQNTKRDAIFIQSIIVVPLIVANRVLGVLAVSRREEGSFFTQDDFEHISTFAEYTSLTINNLFIYMELLEKQEMEREVGIAADIQQQLLPGRLPRFPSATLAAYTEAAKGVSGDYYDVIPIKRNNKLALVICDVAGKGIPASLVMVMIRTIIYLIAGADRDAATVMTWINKGIAGKIAMDRFATMSFMTYDMNSGFLEYSNAAHHPLLIYRKGQGSFEELDTEGIPIGLERKTKYEKTGTTLQKDDIIVMYTDGIIEAMDVDNRQYGIEALREIVRTHAEKDPDSIVQAVRADVDRFVGKASQHDDQTLMIMKAH